MKWENYLLGYKPKPLIGYASCLGYEELDFLPHEDAVERTLAAIFSADVKDYGRIMGENEATTFRSEGECRTTASAARPARIRGGAYGTRSRRCQA